MLGAERVAPGLELPSQIHVAAKVLGLSDMALAVAAASRGGDFMGFGRGNRGRKTGLARSFG